MKDLERIEQQIREYCGGDDTMEIFITSGPMASTLYEALVDNPALDVLPAYADFPKFNNNADYALIYEYEVENLGSFDCKLSVINIDNMQKDIASTCCFCNKPIEGHGNNPDDWSDEYVDMGRKCCDACNESVVIPNRIKKMLDKK